MKPLILVLLMIVLAGCSPGPSAPSTRPPRMLVVRMENDKLLMETRKDRMVPYTVTKMVPYTTVDKDGNKKTTLKPVVETCYKQCPGSDKIELDMKAFRIVDTDGQRIDPAMLPQLLRTDTPVLQCEKFDRYYMRIVKEGTLILIGSDAAVRGEKGDPLLGNGRITSY